MADSEPGAIATQVKHRIARLSALKKIWGVLPLVVAASAIAAIALRNDWIFAAGSVAAALSVLLGRWLFHVDHRALDGELIVLKKVVIERAAPEIQREWSRLVITSTATVNQLGIPGPPPESAQDSKR